MNLYTVAALHLKSVSGTDVLRVHTTLKNLSVLSCFYSVLLPVLPYQAWMSFSRVTDTGEYVIRNIKDPDLPSQSSIAGYYTGDSSSWGVISFYRIDTTKRNYIISGTFAFKAKHPTTGEIIEVTDGRFDLRK